MQCLDGIKHLKHDINYAYCSSSLRLCFNMLFNSLIYWFHINCWKIINKNLIEKLRQIFIQTNNFRKLSEFLCFIKVLKKYCLILAQRHLHCHLRATWSFIIIDDSMAAQVYYIFVRILFTFELYLFLVRFILNIIEWFSWSFYVWCHKVRLIFNILRLLRYFSTLINWFTNILRIKEQVRL